MSSNGSSASPRSGDDAAHAAGGEAVDNAHLEQGPGLHLEVQDAQVVVLVDHPAQPPQAGAGWRTTPSAPGPRRTCPTDAMTPTWNGDAEVVGGVGEGPR
jgi:hypothetical protein